MSSIRQLFEAELKKNDALKDFDNESFRNVLKLIDYNRELCHTKKLTGDLALDLMKLQVIALEMEQKESRFLKWNVTVYPPKQGEDEFSYQFCSPPPNCTRLFISYDEKDKGKPRLTISAPCIVKSPDLTAIKAHYGSTVDKKTEATNITLADTVNQFDAMKLQRIAIVGFARNFPDYLHDEKADVKIEQLKEKALYQTRALYATEAIDSFMGQLESMNIAFTTVNGGWAGQKQQIREVGITFMGHLHGLIHECDDAYHPSLKITPDSPRGGFYPPLTVMPSGGSTDVVHMTASIPGFLDSKVKETVKKEDTLGSRTQFIVEGNWGTDSPYLAALSTSMVVVEPAGRWTQIEMLNAMEQGRPVVILASPENYDTDWMKEWGQENTPDPQYAGLTKGKMFVEIPFPTPSDKKATVRAYKNPLDAANYIAWRYEIDRLSSPSFKTFILNEATQRRLSGLIDELSKENREVKDSFEKLISTKLIASANDANTIAEEFKNLSKRGDVIKKLELWLSPDFAPKSTGYVVPHYLDSPLHLWAKTAKLTTSPTSSSTSNKPSADTPPPTGKSPSPTSKKCEEKT